MGYSPWDHQGSDRTERLTHTVRGRGPGGNPLSSICNTFGRAHTHTHTHTHHTPELLSGLAPTSPREEPSSSVLAAGHAKHAPKPSLSLSMRPEPRAPSLLHGWDLQTCQPGAAMPAPRTCPLTSEPALGCRLCLAFCVIPMYHMAASPPGHRSAQGPAVHIRGCGCSGSSGSEYLWSERTRLLCSVQDSTQFPGEDGSPGSPPPVPVRGASITLLLGV